MTGQDLISSALRLIGVLASGESLPASEGADAITVFKQMLDSWSTESLMIPARIREVFSLTSGKQTYTMGTGGDFNTTRPIRIEKAGILSGTGANQLEFPVEILNQDQFADIVLKATQATYPCSLYEDRAFPLSNVNLWPIPLTSANSLATYSWKPFSSITNLTDTITLPPGYERAIRFNLAIDLAPEYGKSASENVIAVATESKATLKRVNARPRYLKCDSALVGHGRMAGGGGMSLFAGGGSSSDSGDGTVDGGTF